MLDGPFTETKELIGGYAVTEVRSKQEAIELGRRLLQIHLDNWPGWEGSCEIRQLFQPDGGLACRLEDRFASHRHAGCSDRFS